MAGTMRFGAFEFDPERRELRKRGLKVRLPDQSLTILAILVQQPGETVTRERIQSELWPAGTIVGFQQSINVAVNRLRGALGDPAEKSIFIERVPRQGYRFIAPVERLSGGDRRPGSEYEDNVRPASAVRQDTAPGRSRRALGTALAGGVLLTAAILGLWPRPHPQAARQPEPVIIADFDNTTGDSVFDGALRMALLAELGRSRFVQIVSEDRIRSALRLMGRSATSRLDRGTSREICDRTGAKAVVAGSIRILGGRYLIGLEAISCAAGEPIANTYDESESMTAVLPSLRRLAAEIRGRLGESLPAVRQSRQLAEATTSSIEALNAYSVALREKAAGNDALPLLKRVIEIDPDFASAHYSLARVYMGRGLSAEAEASIVKAYALRQHASERERLAIEGLYHALFTGDVVQAIAVGALGRRLYPLYADAWRWALTAYWFSGETEKALDVGRHEIEADPDDGVAYFDYAILLIGEGRIAEARAVLNEGAARGAGAEVFPFARYVIAVLEGDSTAMEDVAAAAQGTPSERRLLIAEVQAAAALGRLDRAREFARHAAESNASAAPAASAAVALMEAAFGLEREAVSRAKMAVRLDHSRRVGVPAALALGFANDPSAAEGIISDLLRRYPDDTSLKIVWSPLVRAAIALRRGDAHEALITTDLNPYFDRLAWPPYIRAVALLKLGRSAQSVAEFRKILTRRSSLTAGAFLAVPFAYPAAKIGLAHALRAGGDADASRETYEEFLRGSSGANPDLPIFVQAKRELMELQAASGRLAYRR